MFRDSTPPSRARRSTRRPFAFKAEPLEARTLLSLAAPAPQPPGVALVPWNGQTVAARAGEWILSLDPDRESGPVDGPSPAGATGAAPPPAILLDAVNHLVSSRRHDVRAVEAVDVIGGLSLITAPEAVGYDDLLASFSTLPGFRSLQPNLHYTIDAVPNDARFAEQWSLRNTGQTGGTAGADIGAADAWDITTGRGTSAGDVVVAVIDTGVDHTHPDLAASMWRNPGEVPGNAIDDDGNGYADDVFGWNFAGSGPGNPDTSDDHGHGTHVAGTIAAAADNGVGVAGVSWGARIMAVLGLGSEGGGATSGAVRSVNYVTMMRRRGVNVRAINASWGGAPFDPALQDAIEAAGDAGVLFVGSAGNGGDDGIGDDNDVRPRYPSGYDLPNIVAVAATNSIDERTGFSNFGRRTVDVGSPGQSILSTVPAAGDLSDPSGYRALSGTSMAAPHVAGVAALAFALAPGASAGAVKGAILAGATPLPALAGITASGGRLNAAQTLRLLRLSVVSSAPSDGESLSAPPAGFRIRYTEPVDPASLQPSDFTVNGVAATGVTLSADGREAAFTFGANPVTAQGGYRMRVAEGAVRRADGAPLRAFDGLFYYDLVRGVPLSIDPPAGVIRVGPDGRTSEIRVRYSEPIDPASVGTDDLFASTFDEQPVRVETARQSAPDTAAYTLAGLLYNAPLLLWTARGAVADVHGNPFGGSLRADLNAGTGHSRLAPEDFRAAGYRWVNGSAGLAYRAMAVASPPFDGPGDVRRVSFSAEAGMAVSVVVTPTGSVGPSLVLRYPSGTVAGTSEAGPGRRATVQVAAAAESGLFEATFQSPNGGTGPVTVEVFLNGTLAREWYGDRAPNGAPANAEDLDPLFRPLPGGAGEYATLYNHHPTVEEPNDAIATARIASTTFSPAAPRLYHAALSASIGGAGDADWFSVGALAPGDVLSATAAAAGSARGTAADTRLRLYRHNGGNPLPVAEDDNSGSGADALLYRLAIPAPDTYYVVIRSSPAAAPGTYQLSLFLEPGAGTAPSTDRGPSAETEPNDATSSATDASAAWRLANYRAAASGQTSTPLPFRGTTAGPADLDYFEYRFNAGDLVTLRVKEVWTNPGPVLPPRRVRVSIRDASDRVLARDDGIAPPGDPAAAPMYSFVVPATGNYYVVVETFDPPPTGSSPGYQVEALLSAVEPPPQAGGRGGDYFRLTLGAGQRLTLHLVQPGFRTVWLEDASGRVVAGGRFAPEVVVYIAPAAGTYYAYASLSYDFAELVVLRDAAYEAETTNDVRESAQDITGTRGVIGGPNWPPSDEDWFRITLAAGSRLRLATYTPADGASRLNGLDPKVELYDEAGALIASDLDSGPDGKNAALSYAAIAAGEYYVKVVPDVVRGGVAIDGEYVLDVDVDRAPWVVGRQVFYNNSSFDGYAAAADARDDDAVAADKVAVLGGATPSSANVTGYSRGINGVMIDMVNPPAGAVLSPEDFIFRTGAGATWRNSPAPASITVRRGAGAGGADRVTLTWGDGVIRNTWLQVTVKATDRTGLTSPDVFYFGNLVGDTGGRGASGSVASVDPLDLLRTRRAASPTASVSNPHDHNRDGRVSPADYAVARSNLSRRLSPIFPTAPVAAPPPVPTPQADGDATAWLRGPSDGVG